MCPKNTGGLEGVIFHCKQCFRAGGGGEVHAVEDAISIILLAIINVALSSDRKLSIWPLLSEESSLKHEIWPLLSE